MGSPLNSSKTSPRFDFEQKIAKEARVFKWNPSPPLLPSVQIPLFKSGYDFGPCPNECTHRHSQPFTGSLHSVAPVASEWERSCEFQVLSQAETSMTTKAMLKALAIQADWTIPGGATTA